MAPSSGCAAPMNTVMPAEKSSAMAAGEMVWA